MPPRADLEPYREQITQWVGYSLTQPEIVERLHEQEGISITRRTLQRRLQDWSIHIQPRTENTAELRDRVVELFWSVHIKDELMVEILQREGFQINQRALQRLRLQLGLKRRNVQDQDTLEAEIREALRKEYADGSIRDFGKTGLAAFMRSHHHFVGRDRIYRVAKSVKQNTPH